MAKKPNTKTFRINNMTGLVNTMAEDTYMLGLDPNANLGPGFTQVPFELRRVENFMPTRKGGLSKSYGYDLEKDVGTSTAVNGLYRYIKASGTNEFIVGYSTTVYKLDTGSLTSIGMTVANAPLAFEIAYDKLIVCDGTNQPQTYDGSSVANLSTGSDATAVTGARQTLFVNNRLFTFSTSHDTSLVYYSDPGDISAGYAANFVQCNVNNGQKITSISHFFIPGDLQPVIIVTKERSFGVIIGDGQDTNPFTYVEVAKDIGVPYYRQTVQFEQDAAFFTSQGICSYKTAISGENLQRRMISEKIANQFTSISAAGQLNVLGWLDWKNRRVTYAIPTGNSTYANKLWHYDIDLKAWYSQTGFDVTAAFVDTDGSVYTGTSTGLIYHHDNSSTNYDGEPIVGTIATGYLDFFEPHYYKRIVDARIILRGNGSYNFGISCSLNNGTSSGSSHTIPLNAGAYTWGMGTWNDTGVYMWGASPIQREKLFPGGIFENISFTFTQTGADEPVDLLEMILEVEYLDLI